jgi:hypothetical protein
VGVGEGDGVGVAEGVGVAVGALTVTLTSLLVYVVPASSMWAAYVTTCAEESLCERDAIPALSVFTLPTAAPSAVKLTRVSGRGSPLASLNVALRVKASLTVTTAGPCRVRVGGGRGVGVGETESGGGTDGDGDGDGSEEGSGVAVAIGSVLGEASGRVDSCVVSAALVLTMLNAPLP